MAEIEYLKNQVKKLEQELAEKSKDLHIYKSEMKNLNQQIARLASQVEVQLNMAARIQKILVPTEIPKFPGFEFSTKYIASSISGGDYFDIFDLGEKSRFGFILAASSGFGMSALLLSVLIKMTKVIEVQSKIGASSVVEEISEELKQSVQEGDSASLLFASLERHSLKLQFSGCGETLMFLSRRSGEILKFGFEAPSVVVGAQMKLENKDIQLDSGDRIVAVSPGVYRVTNNLGEELGEEALQEVIKSASKSGPHDLRNELIYKAQNHSADHGPQRDMTVLVIDAKEKHLRLAKS